MIDFGKYANEFIAFLFFLVVFVWVLKNGNEFNQVLSGISDTYVKTFKGLTAGA